MLSKPKLIGAAVAVTASVAAAAVIGAAAYGSGDPSPPSAAAADTTQVSQAEPAEGQTGETGEAGESGDAETAGARPIGNTAPMDEAMDHMLDAPSAAKAATISKNSGKAVFLVAELNGRNEVATPGGPKVGDRDGRAVQVIRIKGNNVAFAVAWKGIAAPTASHIHEGAAGINGAVKVPFFGTALPNEVSAVTGSVTVTDQALLTSLTTNPGQFYANLHTGEFPGGAVRAQFRKLNHAVDLERALDFGKLVAVGSGKQEVPVAGGPATGDADGRSVGFVWAKGSRVDFALRWSEIAPPTLGHLHQGKAGVNGAVVVPLFNAAAGLPASITGVAGTASGIDRKVTEGLARTPDGFYTNLHTAEFPGGAVRGQLARTAK